jgi:hypothetical protein
MNLRPLACALLLMASALGCSKTQPKDAPGDARVEAQAPTALPAAPAPTPAPPGEATSPGTEPGGGARCGKNTCKPDEYCCNESCGICAPEGGFCTQQICDEPPAPKPSGSDAGGPPSKTGAGGGARGACRSDADCRIHASYCNEAPCMCLALGKDDARPACAGPVSCFADPCMNKVPRCASGTCTAQAGPTK